MDLVIPHKSVFTSISEFFAPPNRAIGPAPRTQQTKYLPSTPIQMRSSKQQLKNASNTAVAKKASEIVPFSTRFALLVFSIRLRFTKSRAGLTALKADAESFRKIAKTAKLMSVVETITTMQAKIEMKLDPTLAVSSDSAPGFRF